jgi:hypothetical protein
MHICFLGDHTHAYVCSRIMCVGFRCSSVSVYLTHGMCHLHSLRVREYMHLSSVGAHNAHATHNCPLYAPISTSNHPSHVVCYTSWWSYRQVIRLKYRKLRDWPRPTSFTVWRVASLACYKWHIFIWQTSISLTNASVSIISKSNNTNQQELAFRLWLFTMHSKQLSQIGVTNIYILTPYYSGHV